MRSFLFVTLVCVAQGTIQSCLEPCYYESCQFNCGGCPKDVTIGVTVQAYMTQMQNMTNDTVILQIIDTVKATIQKAAQMYRENYGLSCDLDCQPNDQHGFCSVSCQDCNPQELCGGIVEQMEQILNQTSLPSPLENLANTTKVFCEPYANTAGQHGMNWLWLGFILYLSSLDPLHRF